MQQAEWLAEFVSGCSYNRISESSREQLRTKLPDAAGRARGADTSPDRAARCNGSSVQYLDFKHSHLALAETAGVSKALGLGAEQTASLIAIGGIAFHTLRAFSTGELSRSRLK